MSGLFGHKGGGKKAAPTPVAAPAPTPTNQNGAFASQNYGGQAQLSNQTSIQRGTFLGS